MDRPGPPGWHQHPSTAQAQSVTEDRQPGCRDTTRRDGHGERQGSGGDTADGSKHSNQAAHRQKVPRQSLSVLQRPADKRGAPRRGADFVTTEHGAGRLNVHSRASRVVETRHQTVSTACAAKVLIGPPSSRSCVGGRASLPVGEHSPRRLMQALASAGVCSCVRRWPRHSSPSLLALIPDDGMPLTEQP